jgi:hypothetical protein
MTIETRPWRSLASFAEYLGLRCASPQANMRRALGAEALPFPVLSLNANAQTEEEGIFTILKLRSIE